MSVVIKECAAALVHVPGFVRYGSKPLRDIADDGTLLDAIERALRTYGEAVAYGPNQAFIGNLRPEALHGVAQPWYSNLNGGERHGPYGEILPEDEFYAWLKMADASGLVALERGFAASSREAASRHPFVTADDLKKLGAGVPAEHLRKLVHEGDVLPLHHRGQMIGCLKSAHDRDDALKAEVLLENLVAKASGALALRHLLKRAGMAPEEVDFIIECSETAVGDRYNRGGGSLSKAIGEMCGCTNATGHDVRAFCASPINAIVSASALVEAGIHRSVAVVGGGCQAKIGMKYAAHLKHRMPILEDLLGAVAFLVTKDDGASPRLRLDSIGKHDIGAGSSQQALMTSLVVKPLERIGLTMLDIDRYATELHNPEVTLAAGSGNTPLTNYRIMASLAALRREIDKSEIDAFVRARGMPGYCPTQGHVPAAVCYLPHACDAMKKGEMKRAMFIAKGSLFLGRMSQASDGMSFVLEANTLRR